MPEIAAAAGVSPRTFNGEFLKAAQTSEQALARVIAARTGAGEDELEPHVLAAIVVGAERAATIHWMNQQQKRGPLRESVLARIPSATKEIDGSLGAMVGGFLILHALLHLVLAVSLSTSSYLVLSKVVNWGTLALGGLALAAYARRVRVRARARNS